MTEHTENNWFAGFRRRANLRAECCTHSKTILCTEKGVTSFVEIREEELEPSKDRSISGEKRKKMSESACVAPVFDSRPETVMGDWVPLDCRVGQSGSHWITYAIAA